MRGAILAGEGTRLYASASDAGLRGHTPVALLNAEMDWQAVAKDARPPRGETECPMFSPGYGRRRPVCRTAYRLLVVATAESLRRSEKRGPARSLARLG